MIKSQIYRFGQITKPNFYWYCSIQDGGIPSIYNTLMTLIQRDKTIYEGEKENKQLLLKLNMIQITLLIL